MTAHLPNFNPYARPAFPTEFVGKIISAAKDRYSTGRIKQLATGGRLTRQQELELPWDKVKELSREMEGLPMDAFHSDDIIGYVCKAGVSEATKSCWITFKVYNDDHMSRTAHELLVNGSMCSGLSLTTHEWHLSSNPTQPAGIKPHRVALCWEGARPGTWCFPANELLKYKESVRASLTETGQRRANDEDDFPRIVYVEFEVRCQQTAPGRIVLADNTHEREKTEPCLICQAFMSTAASTTAQPAAGISQKAAAEPIAAPNVPPTAAASGTGGAGGAPSPQSTATTPPAPGKAPESTSERSIGAAAAASASAPANAATAPKETGAAAAGAAAAAAKSAAQSPSWSNCVMAGAGSSGGGAAPDTASALNTIAHMASALCDRSITAATNAFQNGFQQGKAVRKEMAAASAGTTTMAGVNALSQAAPTAPSQPPVVSPSPPSQPPPAASSVPMPQAIPIMAPKQAHPPAAPGDAQDIDDNGGEGGGDEEQTLKQRMIDGLPLDAIARSAMKDADKEKLVLSYLEVLRKNDALREELQAAPRKFREQLDKTLTARGQRPLSGAQDPMQFAGEDADMVRGLASQPPGGAKVNSNAPEGRIEKKFARAAQMLEEYRQRAKQTSSSSRLPATAATQSGSRPPGASSSSFAAPASSVASSSSSSSSSNSSSRGAKVAASSLAGTYDDPNGQWVKLSVDRNLDPRGYYYTHPEILRLRASSAASSAGKTVTASSTASDQEVVSMCAGSSSVCGPMFPDSGTMAMRWTPSLRALVQQEAGVQITEDGTVLENGARVGHPNPHLQMTYHSRLYG